MLVDIITTKDLEVFKLELIEEIKEMLKPVPRKKWLTSKDVRELLSCSAAFLQNIRVSGKIQGTKIGGRWYYEYSEIENLFQ